MIWPTANFLDVVKDVSGGNLKIPQSEFLPSGLIPVIDQGKDFIAGFTDDEDAKFKSSDLPVIVFGDHTKAIKYIDFPFAMGADGVKVLSVNKDLDSKFFYHYLRQVKIADAGYSRHYKFLKELKIPLPPLQEQRRIAAILDKAESLRAKRREAIAKLDLLLQSVFLEIFGDPVKNEKKWENNNILKYCDFLTGYPFKSANFVEKGLGIKICRGANVLPGYIDWSDEVNYPSDCFCDLKTFQLFDGDIIVAMDRPWINSGFKAVLLREINEKILLVQRVARLRPKEKYYSSFIYKLICSQAFILQCKPTETTIPHISPNDFKNFNIISPPEELIKKFHDFSEEIHLIKQKNEKSLKKLDHLSASLQAKFFN